MGHDTPIEFFKESGIARVEGYVYDDDGVGIGGATVELFRFPELATLAYETTTNENGSFVFDEIVAGLYMGRARSLPLRPSARPFVAKSDQTTQVDFVLYVNAEIEFSRMLDRLRSACDDGVDDLATATVEMTGEYWLFAFDKGGRIPMALMDVAGNVILGLGGDPQAYAAIANPGWVAKAGEALGYGADRLGYGSFFGETVALLEADALLQAQAQLDVDEVLSKLGPYRDGMGTLMNETYDDFLSQLPPVVHSDFDFERANRVVGYVSQRLEHVTEMEDNVIPFKIDERVYFLFPKHKEAFDEALAECERIDYEQKARVLIKIGVGIAALVAAPVTLGGSVAVMAVCIGGGVLDSYVGMELSHAEIAAMDQLAVTYSWATGVWHVDALMLDKAFRNGADFLLDEGNTPNYLDETKSFHAEITHLDINACDFLGVKVVSGPWFGGVASNPADITITNMGDPADVYVQVNHMPRKYPDVGQNESVTVDADTPAGGHEYLVPPWHPGTVFHSQQFYVAVYAGLPDIPTDVRTVDYFSLAWWPCGKGADLSAPLPLSTASKGQLALRDMEELYPTEHLLWEGDLDPNNASVELAHTVAADASAARFYCTHPQGSMIEFFVIDTTSNRIGHNLTTGLPDVQFPGTVTDKYSNPQIVTIPLAGGKTFTVRANLAAWYSDDETHHVILKAFEVPERPAVLSLESDQIEVVASPGSEVTVRLVFAEAGEQQPLEGVQISLGDIELEGDVLPLVSDSPVDVGIILSGTGTSVTFALEVPWEAQAGVYTGELEVTTGNAGSLTVPVDVDVSRAPNKPTMPMGPRVGFVDVPYDYSVSTTDAEEDPFYCQFSWGASTWSDLLGPYDSGETCSEAHEWQEAGVYMVSVFARDEQGRYSDSSDALPVCIGTTDDNGNGFPDECEMEPDELHITGPVPGQVYVGGTGTIDAVVQANTFGQPGWEVVFTKLSGEFTFTAGTVSPDGLQASVVTDIEGTTQMTFTADGAGVGLIQVTVTGASLPGAYAFFEIIEPPPSPRPGKLIQTHGAQDASGAAQHEDGGG